MKKHIKITTTVVSAISIGILICLLIPVITFLLSAGTLLIVSGDYADIFETVGYTTPFVRQTESKIPKDELITNDVLFKELKHK